MAEAKVLSGAGLRGQVAGQTALSTVGQAGAGLTYRGYDVRELAADARFEEVAYLLLYGELPTQTQLTAYMNKLQGLRDLPQALKEVLERIPADTHPMDVMRTGASMLGTLEPETSFEQQRDSTDRLLGAFPAIMCYWYRFSHDGKRINCVTDEDSIGGHFLHLLLDKKPSELHRKVIDVSLILYAEHEFNASTFTARVCVDPVGPVFLRYGGHRHLARPAARRRQRSGHGNDRALRYCPGSGRRHPGDAGAQGQDHGLRSRDLQRQRPAQRGDQGLVEKTGR